MGEQRVRDALAAHGWPDRYLNFSRRIARIGFANGKNVFEPYNWWIRILSGFAKLPVSAILSDGMTISFDEVLCGDREFSVWIEPSPGPDFPWGQPLRVAADWSWNARPTRFLATLGEREWRCGYIVLTWTHEVKVGPSERGEGEP